MLECCAFYLSHNDFTSFLPKPCGHVGFCGKGLTLSQKKTCQYYESFKKNANKGEIIHNKQFLLFIPSWRAVFSKIQSKIVNCKPYKSLSQITNFSFFQTEDFADDNVKFDKKMAESFSNG